MNDNILSNTIDRLLEEGRKVLGTEFDAGARGMQYVTRPRGVELQLFAKWQAGCMNLLQILGTKANIWKGDFEQKANSPATAKRMLGTLEAISECVQLGLLVTVEDLVRAEAFDSLLGQAEYLLSEGYFLAAGVLGRGVIEEHLRKWCDLKSFTPAKAKPTVKDFIDALYKAKEISVTQMKHIESLASIGNDAAHNKPTLVESDVQRLLRDARDLLVRHPLSTV